MRILRLTIPALLLGTLAACGGLPSNGQVMMKASSLGINVGTDPTSGGVAASIGSKSGIVSYNPNTTGGEDAGAKRILSSRYADGRVEDARSMMAWDQAEADGDAGGASLALGTGAANGVAAAVMGCQLGNLDSEHKVDCMEMFK